jgi:uncharacterized membrane protein YphA (DoxX/SURF4 family)
MKIAYYIVTGLMSAFLAISAIPDVLMIKEAVEVFRHLGYPDYLLPFIGVAKLLGVLGVLNPYFPRLREWAYAGLTIDVVGAFYSHISVGDPLPMTLGPVIALVLILGSYFLYRKVFPGNTAQVLTQD